MYMIVDFPQIADEIGNDIEIGGFVHSVRDHGGLIFIDLRSETDILQCVVHPENTAAFANAEQIRSECVLRIQGKVGARTAETINPNISTGKVEVVVSELEIVAHAEVLPFEPHLAEDKIAGEEIRLQYRYLDFRREKLKKLLWKKHELILAVRNWFAAEQFIEVQTPILANSSPEGARDFLVPSRIHPGTFYALPQAPQQFKQLLMVGGFNKYFQIAPCFRDEDPRADRHPGDFYQIDAELAWADPESILQLCQKLVVDVFSKYTDKRLVSPQFSRISYQQALETYGSDKPDLRYDLQWQSVKEVFAGSGFAAFANLASQDTARVQALVVKGVVSEFSRSDLDRVQAIGREAGLPGIAYIQYLPEETKSPIFKFLDADTITNLEKTLDCGKGDLVFFLANEDKELIFKAQHNIRKHLGEKLKLIDHDTLHFVWVEDFPFFETADTGDIDFGHNPFGAWQGGLPALQEAVANDTLDQIVAYQYDIACNGYEVLSGGVRNQNPEALKAAFQAVGYSEAEVQKQFGHMLQAYTYGAPPHAGFAWGLDRLFMVLLGEDNIREVIAFPKNGSAQDTMLASPSVASDKQLKELGIGLVD
jgi:aspartyl-tRNA synthetase